MIKKVNANDIRTLVKAGCKVVAVPYCTAQYTMNWYIDRVGYYANEYGWRYDLYHVPETDIYIVTGYEHPRVAGMIKPDSDAIRTANKLDRRYNADGENNAATFEQIVNTLLG